MTRTSWRHAVVLIGLLLAAGVPVGRPFAAAAAATAGSRRCPNRKHVPARKGDASLRIDLDGDGKQDIIVLNRTTRPRMRIAMSDGREVSLDFGKPDGQLVSMGVGVAIAPLPRGVFGLTQGDLSHIGESNSTTLFRVSGCRLSEVRLGGKPLDLSSATYRIGSTSSIRDEASDRELRCFSGPDVHVELDSYTFRFGPQTGTWPDLAENVIDVTVTRQRVHASSTDLVAEGPEERTVLTPVAGEPLPPFPTGLGAPCVNDVDAIISPELTAP